MGAAPPPRNFNEAQMKANWQILSRSVFQGNHSTRFFSCPDASGRGFDSILVLAGRRGAAHSRKPE